jgi:hypothetical protein
MSDAFIPKLTILRYSKSANGVFGTAFDYMGRPFAVTLEDHETLIPADLYEARTSLYHEGNYQTFEINVPGRTRILIHKLNKWFQSLGCVGIAEKFVEFGPIHDNKGRSLQGPGISESDEGFNEFMKKFGKYENIYVEILEHFVEAKQDGIPQAALV